MHSRGFSLYTRKVVTVSAAAIAAVALSTPLAHAQGEGDEAGGTESGSVDAGSLESGSLQGGSLESVGGQDGSLSGLAPSDGATETCDLPGLGGSVAKFYPLFGLSEMPSGVMDVITSTLDSVPNVLELVAGEEAGEALLGQTGSLTEPLCTTILGGEMTEAPVDEGDTDGNEEQEDGSDDQQDGSDESESEAESEAESQSTTGN